MYDPGIHRVSMTQFGAEWLRQRPYFSLIHNRELLVSVMTHEIVHGLSKAFYRYKANPNVRAQEEYIAYAAQLWTMEPRMRDRLLQHRDNQGLRFSTENSINDMVHAAAPHRFGVMSYQHFISPEGGRKFLERIYTGDYEPVDIASIAI